MSPVAAEATCCVAPANRANLAASFDGGCTPVELRASESVSADPASQAADTNASDAPTGDSLLGSAPLGIPDPNGNTYVFSKDVLDVSLDEARAEITQAGYHCAAARKITPRPRRPRASARGITRCARRQREQYISQARNRLVI